MLEIIKKELAKAIGAEPLLDRAYLYLEDGEREKAKEYFEKVLDKDPRSPFSYLGRLIIATEMADVTDLLLWETSYTEHPDFVKVLRFTEGELHDTLAGIAAERDRIAAVYGRAKEIEAGATDKAALAEAYALYCEVRDFADAEDRLEMILDAASVTAYYAEKARARIENHLAGIKTACKTLRDKADTLTAAVVQTKKTVAELPKRCDIDIIGHFDLLTKNNELGRFIDTAAKEYLSLGYEAIHALRGKAPLFEVNTGAIARAYRTAPYPQIEFLRAFKECGFGAVITSDCHNKDYLDCHFDGARELLRAAGFKSRWILTDGGFKEVSI